MSGRPPSFLHAVLAFLAMPGIVAFVLPLAIAHGTSSVVHLEGLLLLVPGVVGLGWTVRDFYVAGRGTLAPWAPPSRLVEVGLYRVSRNPMYVAVLLVLSGWAWTFRSPVLAGYAAFMAIVFHLRVVLGEEPWLRETHSEAWDRYVARVRRWL